ncbi:hypothetical protein BBK36DRAFT_1189160 [Trichoderma citrinoviride]|uniref:Uncharacterized protein n=1 Tax=Trichoderma citrinoviride TaxID=58853 RepID=A0A2T4BKZ8_9HYPO|nr:hypothetical protein BBK36DRAFT_1189160 [Trichoderma citrinoviride]PTB69985.1 hypothetical protein BBK36DRAFT_1189160 [Trichoderma citrinoviride]
MPVWGPADYVPEIRPFEPPYFFRISQCQKWGAAVTDEMRGDELLWRTYWKRFNTVEIPILPQDEFFDTALSIAKLAGGRRAEFERIFEEKNKQRWGEVKRQLGKTEYHAKHILKGNTYGYEADVVREEPPDKAPNSLDEMQTPNEEYFDEDGLPRSQMFNYDPDICFYEEPSTKDWREPLMADNVFYIGSYAVDYAPPELNDGDEGALNPETGRTSSKSPRLSRSTSTPRKGDEEKTTQPMTQKKRKRKSVRFDDVVDVERHQHQQELDPEENDDDNVRAHKRARLEAPPPHTSSLAQPAADENHLIYPPLS